MRTAPGYLERTLSSFTLPNVTPSMRMAGAKAQQPMQRTVRRVNRPFESVSPAAMPISCSRRSKQHARAADEARRAQADLDRVPPHRLQAEGVVETGHAEDLGQRDLQPHGQILQHAPRQVTPLVRRLLEHRNQRGPVIAVAGQDRIDPGRIFAR